MFNVTIAIPAKNEDDTIEGALSAISAAASRLPTMPLVVVLANDCVDATADRVRQFARGSAFPIRIVECSLPPCRADAGRARRVAMEVANSLTRGNGWIVSTDADAALRPATLKAFTRHFGNGADVVCGTTSAAFPSRLRDSPSLRRLERVATPYAALAGDVRYAIDRLYGRQPAGAKPHYEEAAACMAVSASLWRRLGGLPDIPNGEDRALVRHADRAGARIIYCRAAHASVSARLDGRAAGGMAETLRRTLAADNPEVDEALRAFADIRRDWEEALSLRDQAIRPPVRTAAARLRASDLERDHGPLRAFVAEIVVPQLAAMQARGVAA